MERSARPAEELGKVKAVPGREDWLLLLIDRDATGAGGPDALDPVRIQKGMFLLSKRGPKRDLYHFRPYNWGPFSSTVYGDLNLLENEALIAREQEPGRAWVRFRTTANGSERARAIAEDLKPSTVQWMAATRRFLTTRSFTRLLSDVYDEYPEYATESLFKR
jgi:DNA-binding PadR family transcriptional regulator